ncbi:MAG: ABC transporter substrate-binding protein [Leucobacter sp.]
MKKRTASVAALAAATALVLSGCAGGGGDGGGESAPIKLGSVNTLSGPVAFPEASDAAQAVFERVNAEGGINGRMIEYKVTDDKGNPQEATSAARELVGNDEVVALVGSASFLDCEINGDYYEQEDVRSIQGIGIDPRCFDSPNIAPTNIGPFNDMTLTLLYGSEELGLKNFCVLTNTVGSTGPSYQAAVDRWSEITGIEPILVDPALPLGAADYSPYVVKAEKAGCEVFVSNAGEADTIGILKAANQQGWDDATFLLLTSVYSNNLAEAVDNAAAGIYLPAEFYPFTEDSEANAEWKQLMEENDLTLTSFGQGGYLAATFMVEVLKSIEGDITRESVNEALANMEPIENPMISHSYQFDRIAAQDYEPGAWPVTLKSGTNRWEKAADDWVRIPAA